VLYGPNGFGKTSFFDAIDFAATGGIGRLEPLTDAHFKKTAGHLDSDSAEGVVTLTFCRDGSTHRLMRRVPDRKQASLDGKTTDRKSILAKLTGGDLPSTERVEHYVALFRATHLFSQEHQELAANFRRTCELSPVIVSRFLALEDYANAISKAEKVSAVLDGAMQTAERELLTLGSEIVHDKEDLARLEQATVRNVRVDSLDSEFAALAQKVAELGIGAGGEIASATVLRTWRAAVERGQAESQTQVERLSQLTIEFSKSPRCLAELAALNARLGETESAATSAGEKQTAAEELFRKSEQELAGLIAKGAAVQARLDVLNSILTAKPVYAELREKQRTLLEELTCIRAALAVSRDARERATNDLREKETRAVDVAEKLKAKQTELATIQQLGDAETRWQANKAKLVALAQSNDTEAARLQLAQEEETAVSSEWDRTTADEVRISRLVAEADRGKAELNNLVGQLVAHVQTGICPVCGDDHGSKEELMRRIQDNVATDAIAGTRAELKNAKQKTRELTEQIADIRERRAKANAQMIANQAERERTMSEINGFIAAAAQLGIDTKETDSPLAQQLSDRVENLQGHVHDLHELARECKAAVETERHAVADAKAMLTAKETEIVARQAVLERIRLEADRLRDDPRLASFDIEVAEAEIATGERSNREQLASIKLEAKKAEAELAQRKTELEKNQREIDSLRNQISGLRTQIGNLQRDRAQLAARLEQSHLPPGVSEQSLQGIIAEASRRHIQLLALRDSLSNLEMALDAATTAAALTKIRQDLASKEERVALARESRNCREPWLKYFSQIRQMLASQQREAIDGFARDYGPRTSIIQGRLRSVYGFDDIDIQTHESTINVRVKRRGVELRPTDYFSQSQQQTLLLGLFLTACISQTWSAFAPVFLDDPVTHFDDLNTYAFLDLIVGLLESESGRRQFIISTCDEKLLQLSRQKFRHLGDRAKFYRFSAIGTEGPRITEFS